MVSIPGAIRDYRISAGSNLSFSLAADQMLFLRYRSHGRERMATSSGCLGEASLLVRRGREVGNSSKYFADLSGHITHSKRPVAF